MNGHQFARPARFCLPLLVVLLIPALAQAGPFSGIGGGMSEEAQRKAAADHERFVHAMDSFLWKACGVSVLGLLAGTAVAGGLATYTKRQRIWTLSPVLASGFIIIGMVGLVAWVLSRADGDARIGLIDFFATLLLGIGVVLFLVILAGIGAGTLLSYILVRCTDKTWIWALSPAFSLGLSILFSVVGFAFLYLFMLTV